MVSSTLHYYLISVDDLPYLSSWGLAAITVLKGNTAFARNPQLICTRPNLIAQYFPRAAEALP